MKHLDLFSGIGGFALAAEMVWDNVEHIFCDNDSFAQAILKKHWPNSPIHGDIRTLKGKDIGHIDLLTGGFPCQPFSSAGRRRGTEDDRHLWPEMLRLIRETNPTFILGENVSGLLTWYGGLVLEMVLSDLEEAGYEAGAFIIPAAAVGAPHRRDRVWIAANRNDHLTGGGAGEDESTRDEEWIQERNEMERASEPGEIRDASHSASCDDRGKSCEIQEENEQQEAERQEGGNAEHRRTNSIRDFWNEDWPTSAARLCIVDDGLPNGLARPRGWRNAALKGAGNAIVPQVAAEILRAMAAIN